LHKKALNLAAKLLASPWEGPFSGDYNTSDAGATYGSQPTNSASMLDYNNNNNSSSSMVQCNTGGGGRQSGSSKRAAAAGVLSVTSGTSGVTAVTQLEQFRNYVAAVHLEMEELRRAATRRETANKQLHAVYRSQGAMMQQYREHMMQMQVG
jgi:hypothetical protein